MQEKYCYSNLVKNSSILKPKLKIFLSLSLVIVLFYLLSPSNVFGQLTGTKVIGSGGDYATFAAAVSALNTQGVGAGGVTFNVKTGSYNEQIRIGNISGASASNSILFQSQSGNRADVTLHYAATGAATNYVVKLDSSDYVTFQKLTINATGTTYARVFELAGGVTDITIANNAISGLSTTSSSPNYYLINSDNFNNSNIQISGNYFSGGSWGIVLYGVSNAVPTSGTRILNDTFSTGYGGVYLQYHKSAYINGNVISPSANSGYGINAYDCDDSLQIQKNKVSLPINGYGIIVQYCDGTQFGAKGLTANNFVTVGGNSTAYGIYLESSTWQNVYYNSVNVTSTYTAGGLAFYANNGSNSSVRNNVFANTGGGYAYYVNTTGAISNSNYNDLYSPGSYLAFWNGNNIKDLAAFKTASSKDTNSVFIYPQYLSSTDLHQASPWIDSAGTPLSLVTTDIDGDARDANKPDIGADEFVAAPSSLTPLSGTYTIGSVLSAAADYPTLAAVVSDLVLKGVSAPVTFNIQDGNYNEQISLVSVPGASVSNTITFQSLTNRANVIIYYSATGAGDNYVVKLRGADYITFQNLTLQAIGASYARIFELFGGVDNLKIANNLLVGYATTSSSANYYLISSDGYYNGNIQITGNTFSQGSWGVVLYGLSGTVPTTGTRVLNDTFTTGYGGVSLQYHKSAYVNSNVISPSANSGYGINAYDCDDSLQIQKNKVSLPINGYGIIVQYCDGTQFGAKGLTANNFVTVGGNSTAYGIYLEGSTYQNVYYNSVNITSTYTAGGIAFLPSNGGNLSVRNNVFANNGGGYAYYTSTPSAVANSNYNDLYSPGNFVGYWGSNNVKDLAAFKTASGKDTNSVFIYPQFLSATDLHQSSPWLDSVATPITGLGGVTSDIDGDARDANKPDIGADEFVAAPSSLTPLTGIYSIGSVLSAAADYPTLAAAVSNLVLRGVSGPVTFNIQSGSYNEQINLVSIPGASATNTVTFQSLTGNRNDVTISYSASGTGDNYVVKLSGADYLTFQKLTLQATGISYARVFELAGSVDEDKISNNRIIGYSTTSGSNQYALVYSDNSYTSNIQINDNTLSQGGWGVIMVGVSNAVQSTGTRVTIDTLVTGYGGVYLQYQDSPYANGNVITSNSRGIEVYDCDDSLQIQKNKISVTNPGYGVYLYACDGTLLGGKGLLANNFVHVGGTSTAYGFYIESSTYQDLYYNSVNITSTYTAGGIAFYPNNGGNLNAANNVFANSGGGYTYYVSTPSAVATSNYNDFYATGTNLAYWTGDRTDLAALKAVSGKDINSISVNPKFPSNINLHTGQLLLDSTGTPLALVTDDIDGETRDLNRPDVGADEFYCQAKPGDADGNNQILLPDIIRIINFLFKSQPAPTPLCRGDANADGKILLPDIIYIVNFLFKTGAAPVKVPVCCL